jgi:hypothetical protein
MGAWLAALFFTRSQLVVVAIAAALGLGLALLRRPRQAAAFSVGISAEMGKGFICSYGND